MQALFQRSLASLDEIFAFTAKFFEGEQVDRRDVYAVNLVIEELFTNMVKFNATGPDAVALEMVRREDAVEVRMSDRERQPFDVTEPQPLDVDAPVEKREERGMGLFLVQKFVDSLEYAYRDGTSTITFVKKLGQDHVDA
jgi:anti-sigma regulatory factor (Ser/Thr protein kinase)